METFSVEAIEKHLTYQQAKALAEKRAAEQIKEPMLIAWFDAQKNEEHPHVPECQHKPGWIAYAEGHDGKVRVDVNDKEFSFIFAESKVA